MFDYGEMGNARVGLVLGDGRGEINSSYYKGYMCVRVSAKSKGHSGSSESRISP